MRCENLTLVFMCAAFFRSVTPCSLVRT